MNIGYKWFNTLAWKKVRQVLCFTNAEIQEEGYATHLVFFLQPAKEDLDGKIVPQ